MASLPRSIVCAAGLALGALGAFADFAGYPRVDLYTAIDTPDADFRARPPGWIEHYVFDRVVLLVRRIAAGSRLRLVVMPIEPLLAERNFNSGGVVADETIEGARKATSPSRAGPIRAR